MTIKRYLKKMSHSCF